MRILSEAKISTEITKHKKGNAVPPVSSLRGFLAAVLPVGLLCASTLAWCDASDAVARGRALITERQGAAAYALLEPLETANAGNAEFDYWFGVAALDAGHLDRSLAAFERVLLRQPANDAARLELARVYLRMGTLDLAAQEFTVVRDRVTDAQARQMIDRSLEDIRQAKVRQRRAFTAYVEVGGGRDNNVSSTTRDFPGAILSSFGLPGIEPTGNSIRRSDNFGAASVGGDFAWRTAGDGVAFAASDLRWRGYRSFHEFNSLLGDVIVGYQDRRGELQYTATVFAQGYRQDGAALDLDGSRIRSDRDAFGVGIEARHPVGTTWNLAAALQLAGTRYPDNNTQDTRQVTVSVAAENRPAWWPEGLLVAKAFYANDDARQALGPFTEATASRRTGGVRLLAFSDARASTGWQGALGWSRRVDTDDFSRATLVASGRDDLFEAYVQGRFGLAGGWSLQPYLSHTSNHSNIALYSFRKTEGGLVVRYDYR